MTIIFKTSANLFQYVTSRPCTCATLITAPSTLSAPSGYNFFFVKHLKYAFRVRRFQLEFPHNGIPFKHIIHVMKGILNKLSP